MDDQQATQQPIIINENKQSKNRKGKKIATVFLILLLLLGTGGSVYYWQQQEVTKLKEENRQLSSKLTENTTQSQDSEEDEIETVYKAEVGKFTLTLPHKYVIIKENDGGGEGGPSTSLAIGERTDTEGVFTTQVFSTVTLRAFPLENRGTFRQEVDSILKDSLPQKQPAVTIDGVTAEVYRTEGFGTPKEMFFTKNNIFYRISMDEDHEPTNAQLDAIIKGLKFND